MNEHRVREEGMEKYYVQNTFQSKTGPLPIPAIHAVADMAFFVILTLNHGVLWFFLASYHLLHSISSKTFHVFSSSARSLPLAFPLSPHCLVLITVLLQVASLLYLDISCTSYRNLQNVREGRERWGSGSKPPHRGTWPSWWGWWRKFRMPGAVRNPRVTTMTTSQVSDQANRTVGIS